MAAANHIEADTITMLQEVMEDGFGPLIESYLEDSQIRMDELRTALESCDCERLRRLAHSLKGSSGNVGASQMAALCLNVETLGKEGTLDGVAELLERIETEFEQVSAIMQGYIH